MTRGRATPADMIRTSAELAFLAWEAQAVMAMRLAGMAGMWSVLPSENARMIGEKAPAFAVAAMDAGAAMARGAHPIEVARAWAKPLRRRTRSNARRLSRRGMTGR